MTPDVTGTGAGREPQRLPRESLRDLWNEIRQDVKYRYLPFRAFYRFRAFFYARYRYPELRFIGHLVDRDSAALDVGANLGLYTYFLARACRRVYAFEPNPNPLRSLRFVADSNVTVLPVALSDKSGEADLTIPRGRKGWTNNGAALDRRFPGRTMTVRVPCRRIDDLGIAGIGLIKIDVEGHELAVLRGARETLMRDKPALLVENEFTHTGGKFAEVFQLLEQLGYAGYFLENGVLQTLAHFSVSTHQIEPLKPGGDRRRYVRNFIFLAG
jgi:FkbM family methyltransferase